ncbi:replication factor A protein 1-like [Silene latifolia]|uniref:replication factor A protein 1-like n=1 Tax=Silene latifolia TaxID=37657 RepID=UPI003D7805CE
MQGGKIKTTLFNDDIPAFENIIQKRGEYDISNAKIKVMPEKYRRNADDFPYQLSFGADTIIRAVEGTKVPTGPEYLPIDSIPRTVHPDDRYDLLAVLIYVEPLRQIPRSTGPDLDVRELVVFDHSTSQPLIITAWAELATRDSEQLNEKYIANHLHVQITHNVQIAIFGFSLSTTTSTYVMLQPVGEKVDTLNIWRDENRMTVSVKHSQVVAARNPISERATTTIKELRLKKAADVLQEERFWLKVSIPEFDRKDVRFYLGCSHCGASSNRDTDTT